MPTPIFARTRILLSYKLITVILVLFGLFYWFPLLLASNFDPLDVEFGIMRDTTFYLFPVMFYLGVTICASGYHGLVPFVRPEEELKMLYSPSSFEPLKRKRDGFSSLFRDKGVLFRKVFAWWTNPKFFILHMVAGVVITLLLTYGNWWDFTGLFYSGGRRSEPYTTISSLALLAFGFILVPLLLDAIAYLGIFILIIGAIKFLMTAWQNIYTFSEVSGEPEALSYTNFYIQSRTLSDYVTKTTLLMLIGITFISVFFGVNQFINFRQPNYGTIFSVVALNTFLFILFIYAQIGIFLFLRDAKTTALLGLEKKYFDQTKQFYYYLTTSETSGNITEISTILTTLSTLIEKERKSPVFPANLPIIATLLTTLIPTIFSFAIQFLERI